MPDEEEHLKTCEMCGATIYPEHIETGKAGEYEGKLLCHYCMDDRREAAGLVEAEDDEPIALADTEPDVATRSTKIRQIGGGPGGMGDSLAGAVVHTELTRPLLKDSPNATRCRTFHTKLTDAALTYLNDQINAWVDENRDVEIKFATSTIGVVEGKHADPHLIITVFY